VNKKEPKKTLIHYGCGDIGANAPRRKNFFASFFIKKEVLSYLSSPNLTEPKLSAIPHRHIS